ncbi:MAG: hypothetical protein AAB229_06155 [Candidatus Hydrogenedentota bacterium]
MKSTRVILACLLLSASAAAEVVEVRPAIRREDGSSSAARSADRDTHAPVTTIFAPPPRPAPDSRARQSDVILRLEVPDTISVNRPFRILLRAYNSLGLPAANFSAPVTFECLNGIIPVISSRRWLNGLLEDTLVIVRAGKNTRLVAVAGGATAALHIDVMTPPPDKAFWLKLADEHLAGGKTEDALFCLKKASSFEPAGDPVIEKRIGRIYLDREQWSKAEEHFRRAVRAIAATSSNP